MRTILLLILLITSIESFAACNTVISRSNSSPNTVLTSTKYNLDLNTVYTRVNELPGDCITDATISTDKLENGSVTSAKLATGAIANLAVVTKTANYTAADDDVILGDATSGAITITLPTAAGISGKTYLIKKTDSSTNAVIVDGAGAESIDGAATVSVWNQYKHLQIVSDGTNWDIIAGHKCSSANACAHTFSASISAAGTVSNENVEFITGNCAVSGTSVFTCTVTGFTVTPNCTATLHDGTSNANYMAKVSTSSSSSSLVFYTLFSSSSSLSAQAFKIVCQKQGADYLASDI